MGLGTNETDEFAEGLAGKRTKTSATLLDKPQTDKYNNAVDTKQWQKYVARLGSDAPKTLEEFQKIKYNSPDIYKDLTEYYRYKGNNPSSNRDYFNANKAVEKMRADGAVRVKGAITIALKDCKITEANSHALSRLTERGISQEWAQQIIDNADFAVKQRNGEQYAYYTKDGFAVLNNNGVLVTAGLLDESGKKLFDEVTKNVSGNK